MAENIIATRMALLATKRKIKLANKGHKLLKEKRDALISEFFSIVDELKQTRERVEGELKIAFKSLVLAQAVDGISEVRRSANAVDLSLSLTTNRKTIMGLKVPVFEWGGIQEGEGSYSTISTSVELDEAAQRFRETLETLVKIAEKEATIKALAEEIKKTKRKVNALEQVLIPRLEEKRTYIGMRLEEMERETFGRLKIIKSNIVNE